MARIRDFGVIPGQLEPGPFNAITDVPGVRVGQTTVNRDVDGVPWHNKRQDARTLAQRPGILSLCLDV
jgi:L-aminopeptidase/D-esterase-like protein